MTLASCRHERWFLVALLFATIASQSSAFLTPLPRAHHSARPLSFVGTTTTTTSSSSSSSRLYMSVDSDDPFVVLNLNPTADKKEIKRAYKRMALKSHPDVVCSSASTKEERKAANDRFAKINWAYEQLSGKNGSKQQASSSTYTKQGAGYTPPHRRTSSYTSSSSSNTSTDWRDYIPNYYKEEEEYNTDGDSFGAIFSDLLGGVAAGAAGSGGIFRDFVEFLEDNVDGYVGGDDDDGYLYTLLNTGTVEEVGMEMDDTELVVQSLESKKKNVADELLMKTADQKFATKFSERVELDAQIAELQARKKVVDGYLTKARKRLLSLQSRYKELIVGGADARSYSRTSSSYDTRSRDTSSRSRSRPSSSPSSSYSSRSSTAAGGRGESTTSRSSSSSGNEEGKWKHEGFGSSGRRGRGSSRRGRSRSGGAAAGEDRARQSTSSYNRSEPPRQEAPSPPRRDVSATPPPPPRQATPTSSRQTSAEDWKPPVPPHRRSKAEPSQAQKDKKRLRELQVDDEFDKLKRELGL